MPSNPDFPTFRILFRVLFSIAFLSLIAVPMNADTYRNETEAWRTNRAAKLTAPDSWLSLIGLHWLSTGENTVGSAPGNSVQLSAGPAHFATLTLAADGKVAMTPAPGAGVEVDGQQATAGVELKYGAAGKPTLVRCGTVSFLVIKRGEKVGLRVRDSESTRRRNFAGLDWYPVDPAWRIEATWVPYTPHREIMITNVLGQTSLMSVPGKAVFTREGRTYELTPVEEGPDEPLFFIMADATSGAETYGASRFLYADRPVGDKVILDFNRAQNPPCAFTPFATCPLPPKENRLPIAITAGEKNYPGEHH